MTQLTFADRVQETGLNIGAAADVVLLGAASGSLRTFAAAGLDGKTVSYAIEHRTSGQWEVGIGLYTAASTTLTRVSVLSNSDGSTALINFAAGGVNVWNDLPASKVVALDADTTNLTLPGAVTMGQPLKIANAANSGSLELAASPEGSATYILLNAAAVGYTAIGFQSAGPVRWWLGRGAAVAGENFQLFNQQLNRIALDVEITTNNATWTSPITKFSYSGAAGTAGPVVQFVRTVATARTWQWGVNVDGTLALRDVTAAADRLTMNATGNATFTGTVTATTFIGALAWTSITGKPTTLAGFGITDAYTKTESDARFVQSVTGTSARIAVTGTASAPVVNIDPAYVGQASITTVGTIATGTWNGAPIPPAYGGTGLAAYQPGDLLYGTPASTLATLAGPTVAAKRFLTSTGSGTAANAPVWSALTAADIGTGTFTGAFTFANALTLTGVAPQLAITPTTPGTAQINLLTGATGAAQIIGGSTALRWELILGNGTTESGSDAGNDFTLRARSDAAVPTNVIFASRNTSAGGSLTLTRGTVVVERLAGNAGAISLTLRNGVATGGAVSIGSQNHAPSTSRWTLFLNDGAVESGSDAGSGFRLSAANDAGGPIDNPLTIVRAAGGAITFSAGRPVNVGRLTITNAGALGGQNILITSLGGIAGNVLYVNAPASTQTAIVNITIAAAANVQWGVVGTTGGTIFAGASIGAAVWGHTVGAHTIELFTANAMRVQIGDAGTTLFTGVGFYGTAPVTRQAVSGSRGANAALASLLTALATTGLITDSSTA